MAAGAVRMFYLFSRPLCRSFCNHSLKDGSHIPKSLIGSAPSQPPYIGTPEWRAFIDNLKEKLPRIDPKREANRTLRDLENRISELRQLNEQAVSLKNLIEKWLAENTGKIHPQ